MDRPDSDRQSRPAYRQQPQPDWHAGTRIDRRGVQRVITRLALQVGITRHVTPHGLRRTFASTARRLGASHSDIQHALNQADPRTTDLYLRGDKGGSVSRHLVAELLAS